MVLLALIILLLLSAFPVWMAVKRLAGARQGEGMSAVWSWPNSAAITVPGVELNKSKARGASLYRACANGGHSRREAQDSAVDGKRMRFCAAPGATLRLIIRRGWCRCAAVHSASSSPLGIQNPTRGSVNMNSGFFPSSPSLRLSLLTTVRMGRMSLLFPPHTRRSSWS